MLEIYKYLNKNSESSLEKKFKDKNIKDEKTKEIIKEIEYSKNYILSVLLELNKNNNKNKKTTNLILVISIINLMLTITMIAK